MIGFAMPWLFGGALAAALAITALHFLSVRQPRVLLLPTTYALSPSDWLSSCISACSQSAFDWSVSGQL